MASSYEGVGLYYSSDNIITNNNLMNNQVGIGCYDSSSNSIFHNNFTDNVAQAYAESSANVWDDGYPLGGNYWSDHKGADNYRGSSQNEPGSDGITDSPRTIDQSNVDHFPLMKPYAGSHDIGLRAVFSKTIFPSDYNLTVTANVTIVNYGEQTETFNFTFQMPPSTQEQRITLASRGSNAFGFSWNTTGYGKGKYTISSHVDIVPSETDTTDNTFTVDVTLTILGDVSGDFKVDLNDIVSILDSFGSTVGRPRYNPNMDIDDNGKIDLNDIIVDLDHFGQQSP
jgi:parallel beta-helix repeat protein